MARHDWHQSDAKKKAGPELRRRAEGCLADGEHRELVLEDVSYKVCTGWRILCDENGVFDDTKFDHGTKKFIFPYSESDADPAKVIILSLGFPYTKEKNGNVTVDAVKYLQKIRSLAERYKGMSPELQPYAGKITDLAAALELGISKAPESGRGGR